jgi:chemotaxis protein methyltransferase CheR
MSNSQAVETIVDRVAELLRQRIGLRADPTLRGRLHRAVRDEATKHGQDLTTYFDTLLPDGDALQELLDRVTVQETAFFRHPQHFEVLAREVLPMLQRPVTIWSAGCANGQEAFSLAMLLEEQRIDGRVIATDISTAALQRTSDARYTDRELFGLSTERIARHLTRIGETWQVNKPLRDRVSTLRYNLVDPLPPEVVACHVVFCRNVIIYLSPEHASAFLDRIADTLTSASALFLGAAETIWQLSDRFQAVPAGDAFIYRRSSTASAEAAEASADGSTSTIEVGRTHFKGAVVKRTTRVAAQDQPKPTPSGPTTVAERAREASEPADAAATKLTRAAQEAIAAGDYDAAVVAFRKCAYLVPHDPMAQLNLGLALQAAGDERSAQRAYAAARRALSEGNPLHSVAGVEGIARAELVRLLDSKQGVPTQ